MMTPIIPAYPDWNGSIRWVHVHPSKWFAMMVAVHSERTDEDRWKYNVAPRVWNTYLLGGDRARWYRDNKPERWIERDWVTDLVEKEGEPLFHGLSWNGEPTSFHVKATVLGSHVGLREWEVGDDYSHLWDSEESRWDYYDFGVMRRRIMAIGDEFAERLELRRPRGKG